MPAVDTCLVVGREADAGALDFVLLLDRYGVLLALISNRLSLKLKQPQNEGKSNLSQLTYVYRSLETPRDLLRRLFSYPQNHQTQFTILHTWH